MESESKRKKRLAIEGRRLFAGPQIGYIEHTPHHTVEVVKVLDEPYIPNNNTYVERELVNLGTYFKGISTIAFFIPLEEYDKFTKEYTRTDYNSLKDKHNALQEFNKGNPRPVKFDYNLYVLSKACTITGRVIGYETKQTKRGPEETPIYTGKKVIMPFMYYRSNPSKGKGIVYHTELNDQYNIQLKEYYFSVNMRIIRHMQMGDPDTLLTCKRTGKPVENILVEMKNKDPVYIPRDFELHHINVVSNTSARKGNKDPSVILGSMFLENNKTRLMDIMGTICLSKDAHSQIHCHQNSDVNNYTYEELPWCLQNVKNFDEFCKTYNLDLVYYDFMFGQRNISTEFINKNDINLDSMYKGFKPSIEFVNALNIKIL